MDYKKVKNILKEQKMTYQQLSDISGVSLDTIKGFLSGRRPNPQLSTITKIINALGINSGLELFGLENVEPLPNLRPVPLLGTIACGEPILAEENIEKYVGLPEDIKADFALRCKGDSMINARIFDGDLVFIKQQSEVNNGEIAAVLIDNEATLKRVYKYPSGIELRPENPLFAPINITPEDKIEVRILGKAVSFLSKVV